MVEGDLTRTLQNLIWTLIVVCLLADNAHLLAVSTVSLRSVIHTLTNQVLEVTLLDIKLWDAVQCVASRSAIASLHMALKGPGAFGFSDAIRVTQPQGTRSLATPKALGPSSDRVSTS